MLPLLLATVLTSQPLPAVSNITDFTSDHYLQVRRHSLERQVLERWPGPLVVKERWEGDLGRTERVAILLGGASFHDRRLLPLYREAAVSDDPLLRQAAAFGYRDLIADTLPNVRGGVSMQAGAALQQEIDAVAATLRTRSLPELWMDALLFPEGASFTGRDGVVLRRSVSVCLTALDTLFAPEEINLYLRAFQLSSSDQVKIAMTKFIEAATLKRFLAEPRGPRDPSPYGRYADAMQAVQLWMTRRCEADAEVEMRASLNQRGAVGVQPYAPWSIDVWIDVLRRGPPRWWSAAALQLYRFGGPYVHLSVLRAQTDANDESRRWLLSWYGQQLGSERQRLPRQDPGRILPGPRPMPRGRGEP